MSNASPTVRVIITLCFMGLLTVASIIPGRVQPGDSVFVWLVAKTPTLLQKSLHVCLYATLVVLWAWTLDAIQSKSQRLVIAVTIAVCFGAAMEWFQTKVPGRYGTLADVILNAAGALLGVVAAFFFV
jgi:VanZ family protein